MMNENILDTRSSTCNKIDCASVIAAVGCLELAVAVPEIPAAEAAAVGCVIGGAQAVRSLSTLPSPIGTDRARSVPVSIASPMSVLLCKISVSARLEWP
jgi:hypothetical protein